MKLHYRGNCYESHPQLIETQDTGITAKYRGLTYQGSRPLVRTCSQPLVNLKYRGIAYTIGQAPAIKSRLRVCEASRREAQCNHAIATFHFTYRCISSIELFDPSSQGFG